MYQEKRFTHFQLSQKIPKENFYRRLKEVIHLDFLYKETKQYYGSCGQKSIDPLVFFKLNLVGYLENIVSHRKLMEFCSMRIDILYFLDYVRAIKRVNSSQGRNMKKKRQSTVEPVFGTLINFMGMRKVNTIGIKQANKTMLMSAVAYNLKKYLKHTCLNAQSMVQNIKNSVFSIISEIQVLISSSKRLCNYKPQLLV